ncbi:MAG: pilus assembly protein PilM [bacterium]
MLFGLFGSKEVYVGLDIGNYYVKAVAADSVWQDMKNLKSAKIDSVSKIHVENIEDNNLLINELTNLFSVYKSQKKSVKVIVCISSPNVIVRSIEVPKKVNLDREGMDIARNYIPYKVEDAKYRFETLSEDVPGAPDKKEVLLISFLLEEYVMLEDIISAAGLEKVAIEFDELGVWRLLDGVNYLNFKSTNNIVIDLGHVTTKILVFQDGNLRQLRNIKFGGEEVRKRIVEKLNITNLDETMWSNISFKDQKYLPVLSKAIEPLIKELKRTVILYKSKFEFSNIYIIGGLSYIDGIRDYISQEVSLNVDNIDIYKVSNIKIDKKFEQEIKNNFNIYVNALGLALGHGQQKLISKRII